MMDASQNLQISPRTYTHLHQILASMAQVPPIPGPSFTASSPASPSLPAVPPLPALLAPACQSLSHVPISFPLLIQPPVLPGSPTQPLSTSSQQAPLALLQPASHPHAAGSSAASSHPVTPYSQLASTHISLQPSTSAPQMLNVSPPLP